MISFTIMELVDIIVMTGIVGFIFSDIFIPRQITHTIRYYSYKVRKRIKLEGFKFAIIVTAPAIILHELAHKFTALSFGISATFHAAYFWLFIGVMLKLMNFGFIFFVPGYVSISGNPTYLQSSSIAFAGPAVNLVLWLSSMFVLKWQKKAKKKFSKKWLYVLHLTKQINMFLFILNMLPIPGLDGFKVYYGLIKWVGLHF